MTIDLFEFYHGAALAKLLNHGEKISIKSFPSESNATFTLNNQVKKLLDESFAEAEWIKAHRYRREQYSLTGSDGKLSYKMPKNSFPQDIIDLIK